MNTAARAGIAPKGSSNVEQATLHRRESKILIDGDLWHNAAIAAITTASLWMPAGTERGASEQNAADAAGSLMRVEN